MKQALIRLGTALWRLACWPLTLPLMLLAWALMAAFGLMQAPPGAQEGFASRLMALWLMLTCVVCLALTAEELSLALAGAGLRGGREQWLATELAPLAPREWSAHALALVGLEARELELDGQALQFAARPLMQRLLRSLLYLGLAVAAASGAIFLLRGSRHDEAILVLGQPTALGQGGLVATMSEALVTPAADAELRLQEAVIVLERHETRRTAVIEAGRGLAVAGHYLHAPGDLAAAGVRVEQGAGRTLQAYPIDGARPNGDTARVWFTPVQQERLVAVPAVGLLVRLVRYAPEKDGAARLYAEVLDGQSGATVMRAEVVAGTNLTARGCTITILPEIALRVGVQPLIERVAWLVALALIVAGLVGQVVYPNRRAWLLAMGEQSVWLLDARSVPWDRRWLRRLTAILCLPR